MNYDEFAFFNHQLGAMLREGIPLEGALKQLSAGMRRGKLREEINQFEADLARGTPLAEALSHRDLPVLYRRMLVAGASGNDLPGVLTLLADHYHRANAVWTRLKGLMVYPLLVLLVSLGLTLFVTLAFGHFLSSLFVDLRPADIAVFASWVPPVVLGVLALAALAAVSVPSWRARLRWRLPAFREASLSQVASAIALMLHKGTPLPEALQLAESLEAGTPAGRALAEWRRALELGKAKPSDWPAIAPFPPLFLWLVQKGGEDVAAGFDKAAEIYGGRASYRIEVALYGALPISILFMGQMVLWQIIPLFQSMVRLMNMLGDMGG